MNAFSVAPKTAVASATDGRILSRRAPPALQRSLRHAALNSFFAFVTLSRFATFGSVDEIAVSAHAGASLRRSVRRPRLRVGGLVALHKLPNFASPFRVTPQKLGKPQASLETKRWRLYSDSPVHPNVRSYSCTETEQRYCSPPEIASHEFDCSQSFAGVGRQLLTGASLKAKRWRPKGHSPVHPNLRS